MRHVAGVMFQNAALRGHLQLGPANCMSMTIFRDAVPTQNPLFGNP